MREAVTCSDRLITAIREQSRITVFSAFDASAVTFNSIRDVFADRRRRVPVGQMTDASWTDISSGLIPVGGNVWALGHRFGRLCLCRNGWWRRISQRPIHCRGASRSEPQAPRNASAATLTLVHVLGDNSLPPIAYRRCNTCASLAHARGAFAPAGNLRKRSTHYGDSRVIASPRRNDR